MILNFLALFLILTVLVILVYTFIDIQELPDEAAKHRNHLQQDAIDVACRLSLFTLHVAPLDGRLLTQIVRRVAISPE